MQISVRENPSVIISVELKERGKYGVCECIVNKLTILVLKKKRILRNLAVKDNVMYGD